MKKTHGDHCRSLSFLWCRLIAISELEPKQEKGKINQLKKKKRT
jgi:hypothetical protein